MVQVKKQEVRDAIVEAAFTLFKHNGYTSTTMSKIAREAGTTVSNLYVYFDSKILVLYEIYTPWLLEQIDRIERSVRKLRRPRAQVKRLVMGLWADIPAADQSFANCMIEALASAPRDQGKPNDLLFLAETRISALLRECLPVDRYALLGDGLMAHILWMAFDGFVINQRIGDTRNVEHLADLLVVLLLGMDEATQDA